MWQIDLRSTRTLLTHISMAAQSVGAHFLRLVGLSSEALSHNRLHQRNAYETDKHLPFLVW